MAEYLKSILANREAVVADTVVLYDLPVNPLSFIDIDIEAKQSVTQVPVDLAGVGAIFDRVEVIFKGTNIVSLSGADLMAYNAAVTNRFPPVLNRDVLTLSEQVMRFRIPFGRYPYSRVECFPAVRRGELQLRLDYAATFPNMESLDCVITTTELMGAAPKQFLKGTTLAKTMVVGANDLDLPIGNKLIGVLLYSTTKPLTTSKVTTIDLIKLLVDNVEHYFHEVRWPILNQKIYENLGINITDFDHNHLETAATTEEKHILDQFLAHYGFMDFDPLRNDGYLFETAGAGRVWLRITAGDAAAMRAIPIEIIELGAAG